MTTQEVANRYCELAKQNKWPEILDELCSPDLINEEPEHVMARGIAVTTKGLDAIKAKGVANREKIEAIHSQYCSAPLVAGNFFTVVLGRDITFKGMPRMNKEEVAVFELKDGKIIAEQFFY
ncbi:SnoaL-like domain-containing protein [Ferruginibacter sp. SUN106]|uniref:SnoaL-like domain-containing protein n=1 Tax=Ferruginibacter sp. SUN106 TaxID=2978348 RepID=UPI003D3691A1